jgi:hypothetical protein
MESEHREKLSRQVLQTVESLNKAVGEAGGTTFTCDVLESMTLFEFIWNAAAPNGIRFHLEREEEEEEEEYEGVSKETRPLGHQTNDGAAELTS